MPHQLPHLVLPLVRWQICFVSIPGFLQRPTLTRVVSASSEEIRRAYAPKLQAYLARDLTRITNGRYVEALVSDKFEILLRAPENSSMVDLRHLSRGTQQQVYLLLRLGLLEVMGAGIETLPLFLDDALALADDERRSELLKVLDGEHRQVIYFTGSELGAAVGFGSRWHRLVLPRPTGEVAGNLAREPGPPLGATADHHGIRPGPVQRRPGGLFYSSAGWPPTDHPSKPNSTVSAPATARPEPPPTSQRCSAATGSS